jgi:branched-chain amino acid transport system substrate-binding protein
MKIRIGAMIVIGCALMATAACSSSGPKASGGTASGGPSATSGSSGSSGAGEKATGTPIEVGYVNEQLGANANPAMTQGLTAAVDYVNNELGGINGHPLHIRLCQLDGTAENATQCANNLIASRPAWTWMGVASQADAFASLVAQAKMPIIGITPVSPTQFSCSTCFMLASGTPGIGGSIITLAKKEGWKRINVINIDIPAGKAAADTFFAKPAAAAGIKTNLIPLAPDAADAAPAWTAATEGHPDAVAVLHALNGCLNVMKARQSTDSNINAIYVSPCADMAALKAAGSAANGAYFTSDYVAPNDTANPDAELYVSKLNQYQPGKAVSIYSQEGFAMVMTTVKMLSSAHVSMFTPAAVASGMGKATGVPLFMSAGTQELCNRTQTPGLPGLCVSTSRGHVIQYVNGHLVSVS